METGKFLRTAAGEIFFIIIDRLRMSLPFR